MSANEVLSKPDEDNRREESQDGSESRLSLSPPGSPKSQLSTSGCSHLSDLSSSFDVSEEGPLETALSGITDSIDILFSLSMAIRHPNAQKQKAKARRYPVKDEKGNVVREELRTYYLQIVRQKHTKAGCLPSTSGSVMECGEGCGKPAEEAKQNVTWLHERLADTMLLRREKLEHLKSRREALSSKTKDWAPPKDNETGQGNSAYEGSVTDRRAEETRAPRAAPQAVNRLLEGCRTVGCGEESSGGSFPYRCAAMQRCGDDVMRGGWRGRGCASGVAVLELLI